jgi:hyperosmotically inducible protein
VPSPTTAPRKWPWLSLLLAAIAVACSGSDAGRGGKVPATSHAQELGEDEEISIRVQASLLDDPAVKAYGIDVNTREGIVYLTGSVGTDEERTRAVQLARETAGVKDVRSSLFLRQG